MKNAKAGKFLVFALVLFAFVSSGIPAQEAESKTLNGVRYAVIIPEDFSRSADYGDFVIGDKIVIEGQVMRISGAYLTIRNAGATNRFILEAPTRLEFGTEVTIYVEISKVNSDGVEAKIVKLESAKGNGQIAASTESRSLDGVQYKVLQPEEYAFLVDLDKLKPGEKYVIDDNVMSLTDTALILRNAGMTRFPVSTPQKISPNGAVRVYIEISGASPAVEARIVKLENR
jgi:hypothetical protein